MADVQVFVSIQFTTADPASVEAIVGAITGLPLGAVVSTSMNQAIDSASGVVGGAGAIVPTPTPEPPPVVP